MWESLIEPPYKPKPKAVRIDKYKEVRKTVEKALKTLKQEWGKKGKRENIRMLHLLFPNNGSAKFRRKVLRVSTLQIIIEELPSVRQRRLAQQKK